MTELQAQKAYTDRILFYFGVSVMLHVATWVGIGCFLLGRYL